MNIRAANFRDFDFEQRGVWFEIGFYDFTHFDWRMRFGDYGNERHGGRIQESATDFTATFAPLRENTV
jgi:hypothetical protein